MQLSGTKSPAIWYQEFSIGIPTVYHSYTPGKPLLYPRPARWISGDKQGASNREGEEVRVETNKIGIVGGIE